MRKWETVPCSCQVYWCSFPFFFLPIYLSICHTIFLVKIECSDHRTTRSLIRLNTYIVPSPCCQKLEDHCLYFPQLQRCFLVFSPSVTAPIYFCFTVYIDKSNVSIISYSSLMLLLFISEHRFFPCCTDYLTSPAVLPPTELAP